jgi:enoyl-[acyl-carrier protein] reductase II
MNEKSGQAPQPQHAGKPPGEPLSTPQGSSILGAVDFSTNRIVKLFGTSLPIIQAGMVWVSGSKLAAAASNAGALGIIGAGSMKPELLRHHILQAKTLTQKPIGVNLPLLYHGIEEQIAICLELGIKIFFTSAGSPKKYTSMLKANHCVVVHVTSTPDLAKKCEDAGVDAVVAEGFEAGGHNGRDEITTMVLIPEVVDAVKIPVIAAGGIADGRQIAAAMMLGASAVQMGSRFAATQESSAHPNFRQAIMQATPTSTMLAMKKSVPVRLLKNKFFDEIAKLEGRCASVEELEAHLGKGRAKAGMLDGDLENGELEIGQVSGMIKDIPSCQELVTRLMAEYSRAVASISR